MRLLSSRRANRTAIQVAFVALLSLLLVSTVVVGHRNITGQGIATGFGFLERTTGWPIAFSVLEVSSRSTYARVLLAGLANTLLVGTCALVLASVLGFAIALLRVSGNRLMGLVGATYVEVFRNVPVILQVFFWYAILTHLPSPRDALDVGGMIMLSNRGLMVPAPALSGADVAILVVGLVLIVAGLVGLRARASAGLRMACAASLGILLFVALLLAGRAPDAPLFTFPELRGLRFVGGLTIKPEFAALLVGLVLFGAAYIGEIIRGGLLSVDRGRLEAGAALGLTPWQVNRLIRIPLAVRAILPSLSNQYIWLMKATTVGIAIGFPDYFAIVSASINQTGQALELLALLMIGFVAVNYAIGSAMNVLNRRLDLAGKGG